MYLTPIPEWAFIIYTIIVSLLIIAGFAIIIGRWIKRKQHADPKAHYDSGYNYERYGPESNDKIPWGDVKP